MPVDASVVLCAAFFGALLLWLLHLRVRASGMPTNCSLCTVQFIDAAELPIPPLSITWYKPTCSRRWVCDVCIYGRERKGNHKYSEDVCRLCINRRPTWWPFLWVPSRTVRGANIYAPQGPGAPAAGLLEVTDNADPPEATDHALHNPRTGTVPESRRRRKSPPPSAARAMGSA